MYKKRLAEFLNKYMFVQYIFVILPILMVSVYSYAYMTDVMSNVRVFANNDRVSEQAWQMGALKEVVVGDDYNTMVVVGSEYSDEVVEVDDVIFYIQTYGPDWYQLVTASKKSMFMEQCDLFGVEDIDGEIVRVTHDDISLDFEYGDLVCGVTITDEGLYRVTFLVEDAPSYDLEELHMLEFVGKSEEGYKVRVWPSYTLDITEKDVNFCTSLPTGGMYYDESSGSLVRNVSSDFAATFLLRSNIFIVILSVFIYNMLLWKLQQDKLLMLLENRYLLRVNWFTCCIPVLCVIFTWIMF